MPKKRGARAKALLRLRKTHHHTASPSSETGASRRQKDTTRTHQHTPHGNGEEENKLVKCGGSGGAEGDVCVCVDTVGTRHTLRVPQLRANVNTQRDELVAVSSIFTDVSLRTETDGCHAVVCGLEGHSKSNGASQNGCTQNGAGKKRIPKKNKHSGNSVRMRGDIPVDRGCNGNGKSGSNTGSGTSSPKPYRCDAQTTVSARISSLHCPVSIFVAVEMGCAYPSHVRLRVSEASCTLNSHDTESKAERHHDSNVSSGRHNSNFGVISVALGHLNRCKEVLHTTQSSQSSVVHEDSVISLGKWGIHLRGTDDGVELCFHRDRFISRLQANIDAEQQGEGHLFQCFESCQSVTSLIYRTLSSQHAQPHSHTEPKVPLRNTARTKPTGISQPDGGLDEDFRVTMVSGDLVVDRKSVFQGHAFTNITSTRQIAHALKWLYNEHPGHRKIQRATHNMVAYRFVRASNEQNLSKTPSASAKDTSEKHSRHKTKSGKRVELAGSKHSGTASKKHLERKTRDIIVADNDEDSEHGAGAKLSMLLHMLDVRDVLVVVSRWYGGVHLGPVRFAHINNAARSALVKAGRISSKS